MGQIKVEWDTAMLPYVLIEESIYRRNQVEWDSYLDEWDNCG